MAAQSVIAARVARYDIEACERPGRWRWVVERPLGWLCRYRRLAFDIRGGQPCTARSLILFAWSTALPGPLLVEAKGGDVLSTPLIVSAFRHVGTSEIRYVEDDLRAEKGVEKSFRP